MQNLQTGELVEASPKAVTALLSAETARVQITCVATCFLSLLQETLGATEIQMYAKASMYYESMYLW